MATAAAALEEKKEALDRFLRHLPAEALEILAKVNRNVHKNPMENKYRRLKLKNAKIAAALGAHPEAMAAMGQVFGWEQVEESEDGEGGEKEAEGETQPVLRLPPNRYDVCISMECVIWERDDQDATLLRLHISLSLSPGTSMLCLFAKSKMPWSGECDKIGGRRRRLRPGSGHRPRIRKGCVHGRSCFWAWSDSVYGMGVGGVIYAAGSPPAADAWRPG